MDAERILRHTIPGWALLLSLAFHYWVLGGRLESLVVWGDGSPEFRAFATVLVSVATSPLLGMLTHTVTVVSLLVRRGRQQHFYIPNDRRQLLRWLRTLRAESESGDEIRSWTISRLIRRIQNDRDFQRINGCSTDERILYLLSNRVFWGNGRKEIQEFVVRGWTHYWALVNSFTGFSLGFFIALAVRATRTIPNWENFWNNTEFRVEKLGFELIALTVFIGGTWYAEKVLRPDALQMAFWESIRKKPAAIR